MIVICESCGVKYFLDEKELSDNGRIVRCTSCEHEWLLQHPQYYERLSQLPPKKLFALATSYFNSHKLIIVSGFLLLMAIFLFYNQKALFWVAGEKTSSYFVAQNLIIDVISYKIEDEYSTLTNTGNKRKWLLVTITVRNDANYAHKLETIRVLGLNYNQQEISNLIVSPEELLDPGESTVVTIKAPVENVIPSYIKILLNKERDIDPRDSGQSKNLIKIENK